MQTLKPLYSDALWLAVTSSPPCTGSSCSAKYMSGVGHMPMSITSTPHSTRPRVSSAEYASEVSRQSRPTAITGVRSGWRARRRVPTARPSAWAKASSKSSPAMPRMSYSRKIVGFIFISDLVLRG